MSKRSYIQRNQIPPGIYIFSFLLIFAAIYKLVGLWNFEYYKFMFQYLPEETIKLRYFGSIALRIFELIVGIGILSRRDVFRRCVIGLAIFTLVALYWKHPYYVFHNISVATEGTANLKYPDFPIISMLFYMGLDIIFSIAIISYFKKRRVMIFKY